MYNGVLMCVYYNIVQDFLLGVPDSVVEGGVEEVVFLSFSLFDELLGGAVVSETLALPSAVGVTVFSSVSTCFSVVLSNDLTSDLVSFFSSSITKNGWKEI